MTARETALPDGMVPRDRNGNPPLYGRGFIDRSVIQGKAEPAPAAPTTLPGALAAEISRVTDLRAQYREAQQLAGPQANMAPAIHMMTMSIDAAIVAAGSPDVAGQVRALEDLRGFTS